MKKTTLLALAMGLGGAFVGHAQADGEMAAYLFSYFTGNSPSQEQICYAISYDGFNYTPLNGGRPVIASDSIALTGCVRDPHILRGEDGYFYMVATDMKSSLGWQSNHGLVLLRSTDLISWEHHAIDFQKKYPGTCFANAKYVWAPQTIYDEAAGKYMLYFAFGDNDVCKYQTPYYVYANEDFSDLEGEPKMLFDRGAAAIDMDIVVDDEGVYHCFYKDESTTHGITQCTFAKADLHNPDKWNYDYPKLSYNEAAEGSGVFRLLDGDWCLMWDCYNNGHYTFTRSHDLYTFTKVQDTKTRGAFTPRHGTVIGITRAELDALQAAFPCASTTAEVPAEAYLVQAESYMSVGMGANSAAALFAAGEAAPLKMVPSEKYSGYYSIVATGDGGEQLYMGQYDANGWTVSFSATGADTEAALWGIEDKANGYVVLRNSKTGAFLGSDAVTAGSYVFGDKSGNDVKHQFILSSTPDGLSAAYAAMLGRAAALEGSKMSAKARQDLAAAAIDAAAFEALDAQGRKDAIKALSAALSAAEASASAYAGYVPTLAKMQAFAQSTNVYTPQALADYLQPLADYENGTLEGTLMDPYAVTGWHATVDYDDLLMSAWGIPVADWGTLHVNTWSVEGVSDGTDFLVPFQEYWVGDADRLGARTFTATVEGVEPLIKCKVNAWVRVRRTNNSSEPHHGVVMSANGSEPVDVCDGEAVGAFTLGHYTVECETDADGVLRISFSVLDGNNISWLSFRDLTYVLEKGEGIHGVEGAAADDAPLYDLQGRRVENAAPGLYIRSGKKVIIR